MTEKFLQKITNKSTKTEKKSNIKMSTKISERMASLLTEMSYYVSILKKNYKKEKKTLARPYKLINSFFLIAPKSVYASSRTRR